MRLRRYETTTRDRDVAIERGRVAGKTPGLLFPASLAHWLVRSPRRAAKRTSDQC